MREAQEEKYFMKNRVEKGFLIKKGSKYSINSKRTTSILLNQLHIDLLVHYQDYIYGKLLDAGCGEKPYSLLYDELVSSSIGCDVENCIHDQRDIDVFATLDDLPFTDNEFDTILCTNVLEHVADAEKGFMELARCLKKGGHLIISTPFLAPLHEAPYDFYRYTKYGIKHQIEKNGLKVVHENSLGGVGLMFAVYFNWFITRIVKIAALTKLNCRIQEIFYKLYKKVFFKKICNGSGKLDSIISMGYFVVVTK